MDKATKAKAWHDRNGIVCGTCKHFKGIEAKFGKKKDVLTYCDLYTYGRGRFIFEYFYQWEAKDEAGQS